MWKSKDVKSSTKFKIFNSDVKSVLLNGSETWIMIKTITNKQETCINWNLCRTKVKRYDTKAYVELIERTKYIPLNQEVILHPVLNRTNIDKTC